MLNNNNNNTQNKDGSNQNHNDMNKPYFVKNLNDFLRRTSPKKCSNKVQQEKQPEPKNQNNKNGAPMKYYPSVRCIKNDNINNLNNQSPKPREKTVNEKQFNTTSKFIKGKSSRELKNTEKNNQTTANLKKTQQNTINLTQYQKSGKNSSSNLKNQHKIKNSPIKFDKPTNITYNNGTQILTKTNNKTELSFAANYYKTSRSNNINSPSNEKTYLANDVKDFCSSGGYGSGEFIGSADVYGQNEECFTSEVHNYIRKISSSECLEKSNSKNQQLRKTSPCRTKLQQILNLESKGFVECNSNTSITNLTNFESINNKKGNGTGNVIKQMQQA